MNAPNIAIRMSMRSPDEDRPGESPKLTFEYTCGDGNLDCEYSTADDSFCIDDLYVEHTSRKRGIGKQLLRAAKHTAETIGSHDVYAYIHSKECLQAMTRVFGSENIRIAADGDYAPTGEDRHPSRQTNAMLHYDASTQVSDT